MAEPVSAEENVLGLESDRTDSNTDKVLSELFKSSSESVTEDLAADKSVPAAAVDPNTERLTKLEAELETHKETTTQLKVENEILKSGLLSQRPAPQGVVTQYQQPAPPPAPKGFLDELGISKEQLNEGLRTDAAGTITNLLERATERAYQRAKTEATNEAVGKTTQYNQLNQQLQSDQQSFMTEYGELFKDNPEFKNLADTIYNRMTEDGIVINNQGTKWKVGAMYNAASVAYAQMSKAGKFNPKEPDGKVVQLNERRPKPEMPVTGTTGGDGASNRNSLTEGLAAEDLTKMKATAGKLGVPFERYLKTFQAMKRREPGFGG